MSIKDPQKSFSLLSEEKQIGFLLEKFQVLEQQWEHEIQRRSLLQSLLATLRSSAGSGLIHSHVEIKQVFQLCSRPDFSLAELIAVLVPLERKYGRLYKDQDFLVHQQDRIEAINNRHPLTIVLENIRSAFNVGSIFRTADCLAVQEVLLCGYTATPELEAVKKTALGAAQQTPWQHFRSTATALGYLKEKGVQTFGLETCSHAQNLFEVKFSKPCALILGNERYGLNHQTIASLDAVVRIPTWGVKNSLNVANAMSIAGYAAIKQF